MSSEPGARPSAYVKTFSTALNNTYLEFPLSPLAPAGTEDECQAYIKVSNSLLGILNVLVIAHDDEGDIGFDRKQVIQRIPPRIGQTNSVFPGD